LYHGASGDGDEGACFDSDLFEECGVFFAHAGEDFFGEPDEIHFVDGDDDLFDSEEGEQVAVASTLFLDAFICSDEKDGGIGAGGTGDHVLEELFMTWRVDDDVGASVRSELDLGGVDGDVLLLLFEEGVEEEGVFKVHALGLGGGLDLGDFSIWKRVGVVEDASDEGGFTVVYVADEDDAQPV
jgi:hypothetical protein